MTTTPLSSKQTRYLRGLAHHLNPLVSVGKNGLTPALNKELDRVLADHELIKVRIGADDREAARTAAEGMTAASGAALVQLIGRIAVLYRPAVEPEIRLP